MCLGCTWGWGREVKVKGRKWKGKRERQGAGRRVSDAAPGYSSVSGPCLYMD